jgi:DNA replication and repair protein RecF
VGLTVTRLALHNFRSYAKFEIEPDPKLTILAGPNATGKTNVVEAIQLVTAGDSFRRPQWAELVRWGEPEASILLEAKGEGRALETLLTVGHSGRRVYRVNGKVRRRVSEVAGIIPCVTFTPDDLRMVKDSADRRRAAIDGVGDQLSPAYLTVRLEYERTVRQRNALLKNAAPNTDVLNALTERLIVEGSAFMGHRHRLFDRVSCKMSEVYSTLAQGESLLATYVPSWKRVGPDSGVSDPAEAMRAALSRLEAEERARGLTLIGPHRDEVSFSVNGREARTYASQGQMRTIALAWKLAEVAVITEIAEQAPVLLLDDVMSELDETRRHTLAAFVGEAAQTFMTTTNLGYFEEELVSRAKVVSIP